jgi:L-asparaginase/beta-aspartyl-peptidase (threonine type)
MAPMNIASLKRNDEPGAVVTHGGAAGDRKNLDGCRHAATQAAAALGAGRSALDAAIAAVVALENDGRFNAGRGAVVGLDGETFELSASVMDSAGALGAVAAVRNTKNPIELAAAVTKTPHWCIAGEGADRLARRLGLAEAEFDRERAQQRHRQTLQALRGPSPVLPGVDNGDFHRLWNYAMPWDDAMRRFGCGTVGAVARDAEGRFAVATSTGGVAPALLGRVGDSSTVGCGFYCGDRGAIGATGIGEAIVRQMLARTVYQWLLDGRELQDALDAGVALFDDDIDIGLIGVTATAYGSASNRPMPTVALEVAA